VHRQRLLASALVAVRFETRPGEQMQSDFGERRVWSHCMHRLLLCLNQLTVSASPSRWTTRDYGSRKQIIRRSGEGAPSMQTLMNWATVCRAFEPSRRREGLSFSYHAEVAELDPVNADKMLDWCEPTARYRPRPRSELDLSYPRYFRLARISQGLKSRVHLYDFVSRIKHLRHMRRV
jgi:hypothetical protein